MDEERLTASECAARTGLTIRALRLYERYGLVTPLRTQGGWRYYGRRELTRLNTVCVLKAAGLTLAQIQAIVRQKDPPLQEILQAQVASWNAKREEAEKGRRMTESALQHLLANRQLSLDELCDLIRSHRTGPADAALRTLFARILGIPAEQRRAAVDRLNDRLAPKWSREFQQAVRTLIDPALERMMDAGLSPGSAEVQQLVSLHLQLMARYEVREQTLRWAAGDSHAEAEVSDIAPRFLQGLRVRVLPRLKQRPTEESDLISNQWTSNPFLVGYFAAAELQSRQCVEPDGMVRAAQPTLQKDLRTRTRAALQFARRLRKICREHTLGDPLTYAQWAALARPPPSEVSEAEDKAVWDLVAEALRSGQTAVRKLL